MEQLLFGEENAEEAVKKVQLDLAVEWIKKSWFTCVKPSTIQNSFAHVGFNVDEVNVVEEGDDEGDTDFLALQLSIEEPIYEENIPVFNENDDNWEEEALHPCDKEIEDLEEEEEEETLVTMEEMRKAWTTLRTGITQRPTSRLFDRTAQCISIINEAFAMELRQRSIQEFLLPANSSAE